MQEISSNPQADSESIWRPDVTVATIVARDGRFLVVEERVRGELVLNQPAGHLEPDESLIEAARRETLEETGWTVEVTHLVSIYQWTSSTGDQFVRFAFAATALRHDPHQPLDTGIVRAVWLTRDEIASGTTRLRSPMVLKGINDWESGQRLPLNAVQRLGGMQS